MVGSARAADQTFEVIVSPDSTSVISGKQRIGELKKGTRLTVSRVNGDWYLVDIPGAIRRSRLDRQEQCPKAVCEQPRPVAQRRATSTAEEARFTVGVLPKPAPGGQARRGYRRREGIAATSRSMSSGAQLRMRSVRWAIWPICFAKNRTFRRHGKFANRRLPIARSCSEKTTGGRPKPDLALEKTSLLERLGADGRAPTYRGVPIGRRSPSVCRRGEIFLGNLFRGPIGRLVS